MSQALSSREAALLLARVPSVQKNATQRKPQERAFALTMLHIMRSHNVQTEAASAASVVRRALEPTSRAFAAPYTATLAALAKFRDRDAKHGPRFALENLAHLQPAADELAGVAPDLAVQAKDIAAQLKGAQVRWLWLLLAGF